jgi:DNA-directed RNA polymerase specialized sigma24 family protein
MNIKFWSNHRFDDPVQLLEALRQGNSGAIIFSQNKAIPSTRKLLKQYRLPEHLLPEVLNDASVIFIKKLREPEFSLHSAKPLTYFIEIIKKVVSNETRKRQIGRHEPIENQYDLSDSSIEDYHARKETIELLNSLLSGAGASCEQVIRLKYLDGFSDEEAIQKRLTSYSTVESLRQKRSDCMKKLKERVASQKNIKI